VRRAALLATAAAAAAVAACSLTSLDGLTGSGGADGGGGGGAPDAGAGSDVATIDGGGPVRPDAGLDAAPGPFCATHTPPALFCEDFDHPVPSAGWEIDIGASGGDASVDDAFGRSPPRSIAVFMPSVGDGGIARFSYSHFPASASWRFGFALHVESAGTSVTVARVYTDGYGIRVYAGTNGVAYADEDFDLDGGASPARYSFDNLTSAKLIDGAWHRVELTMIVAAGSSSSSTAFAVDGVQVIPPSPASAHRFPPVDGLYVGASKSVTITGTWALHIDDIVFEVP